MLDYGSEDIDGMDDDAGEEQAQNPPFTGRWTATSSYDVAHPLCFSDEVMEHEFPEGFKPMNIESYDGTTNPTVWIEDFLVTSLVSACIRVFA